jgi:hypothetical protein
MKKSQGNEEVVLWEDRQNCKISRKTKKGKEKNEFTNIKNETGILLESKDI